jgi:plasmid rolling circle replication initiator protein Rep
MKWQAKMFQAMPEIKQAYPTHRWLFVTLTVRNCDLVDLRTTVTDMNKAFVRLSQLKRFPAIGWIKSVEVTRNSETGQAHPHFHCLMLVPSSYFGKSYIKQDEWRSLWQRCLRSDYLPVVNVKAVKPKLNQETGEQDDIGQAIVEVLKYSVKEEDLVADENWLVELTSQLHKTRAIAIGGVLKQFLREEKEDDDLINIEEKEELEEIEDESIKLYFGWRETLKRYKRQ